MSVNTAIHVFSKSNCDFCTRAKSVLHDAGVSYIEHDVEQSPAMAAASQYYSGSMSVPQIFIGRQHINGAEDLESLHSAKLLDTILDNASGELPLESDLEQDWVAGAKDYTLSQVLDKVDLTESMDDEENLLILNFYKGFFGFTPISYLYLAIWQEAYKSCALSNVIATFPVLMGQLGPDGVSAVTYTASSVQGCTYCTVHTAARDGVEQTKDIKALKAALDGSSGPDNPYGELEVAMVGLAEQATLNRVTDKQIAKVSELAKASSRDPESVVQAVSLGAGIMALLNIFNDLLNVELEGDMAAIAAEELGLESGRHATTEGDPDDLGFELPEPKLTVETALAARRARVSDWEDIVTKALGYVPAWLSNWPKLLRSLFAGMYAELMGQGEISSELKHLMARTSAIAKGHVALAASAAISAHHSAADKDAAIQRIQQCYSAATGQSDSAVFAIEEKLALRLAWLSAQTPIITPAQFVEPLPDYFSQRQIVELCVACGMACAAQRVAAGLQVTIGAEEEAFCREHGIETECLVLKYPIALS